MCIIIKNGWISYCNEQGSSGSTIKIYKLRIRVKKLWFPGSISEKLKKSTTHIEQKVKIRITWTITNPETLIDPNKIIISATEKILLRRRQNPKITRYRPSIIKTALRRGEQTEHLNNSIQKMAITLRRAKNKIRCNTRQQ